jgi:hypothetical protein
MAVRVIEDEEGSPGSRMEKKEPSQKAKGDFLAKTSFSKRQERRQKIRDVFIKPQPQNWSAGPLPEQLTVRDDDK